MSISVSMKTKLRIVKCLAYLVVGVIFMCNTFFFMFSLDKIEWPLVLILGVIGSLINSLLFDSLVI